MSRNSIKLDSRYLNLVEILHDDFKHVYQNIKLMPSSNWFQENRTMCLKVSDIIKIKCVDTGKSSYKRIKFCVNKV